MGFCMHDFDCCAGIAGSIGNISFSANDAGAGGDERKMVY